MECVRFGGQEHLIEVKPVTVIVKSPTAMHDVEYPERVALDGAAGLHHIERVQKLDDRTPGWVLRIFQPEARNTPPPTIEEIRGMGIGQRQTAGLIDLALKLRDLRVPFALVHPEANLHPAAQLGLADFVIFLSQGD